MAFFGSRVEGRALPSWVSLRSLPGLQRFRKSATPGFDSTPTARREWTAASTFIPSECHTSQQ